MKILVAIPCYNCAKQIERVLTQLKQNQWECDFLFVDNHSNDNTVGVITENLKDAWAQKHNIKLIIHQENYGLGGSFKTITEQAVTNKYDYLVLFHGDDQASPLDLKNMLKLAQQNTLDAIFGARFMKGSVLEGYSKIREIGNRFINCIYSRFLGVPIHEIGSGLNAYKVNSLPLKQINNYPNHIAFDICLLFHFIQKNYLFIPIHWREKDQVSNARNLEVGLLVLKMLWNFKRNKSITSSNTLRAYSELFFD